MGRVRDWKENIGRKWNEKNGDTVFASGSPNHPVPAFYHWIGNWNHPESGGDSSFWTKGTNTKILQGSIQPDHVYMLLLCPTNLSPSEIMQNLKGKNKGYYKRSSHN